MDEANLQVGSQQSTNAGDGTEVVECNRRGRGRGHGRGRGRGRVESTAKPARRGNISASQDYMEATELQEVSQVNDEDLANVLAHLAEDADSTQGENVAALDIENEENLLSQNTQSMHSGQSKCTASPRRNPQRRR